MTSFHKTNETLTNLTINSKYRTNPTVSNSYNCSINLIPPVGRFGGLRCEYVDMDYSVYNVETGVRNNMLDVQEGITIYEITIEPGVYPIDTFASTLESALNGGTGSRTYTVEVVRPIVVGTVNVEYYYRISNSTIAFDLLFATGPNVGSNMRTVLGFAALDYVGLTTYSGSAFDIAFREHEPTSTVYSLMSSKIDITDPTSTYTATLTAGYYTTATFPTELQTQLNAAALAALSPTTYTVAYIDAIFKYRITGTTTFTILSLTGQNRFSSCYRILGLHTTQDYIASGSNIVESAFPPIMSRDNYGYITCDICARTAGRYFDVSTLTPHNPLRYESIIAKFEITVNPGASLHYEIPEPKTVNLNMDIVEIAGTFIALSGTFKLMYADGRYINLNGSDWSVFVTLFT